MSYESKSMRARRAVWICLLLLSAAQWGCSQRGVRCDGPLQPVNAPRLSTAVSPGERHED